MKSKVDLDMINQFDGFAKDIGIVITKAKDGAGEGVLELENRHFNPIGSVHGGCLFALIDTACGIALSSADVSCTTLSSSIEYLKGAMKGVSHKLYAKAKPIRIGRKIAVYEAVVEDEHGTLICHATVEFYVMSEKYRDKYAKESYGIDIQQ